MEPRIIINTITSWDEPPRARHQFTYAIARKIPVVFIARNKVGWPKLALNNPENNITLIEPSFPMDYRLRYRLPLINELYQLWLFAKLKNKLGNLVVVNFDFTAAMLSRFFQNRVYYCNDEYTSTSKYNSRLINAYISKCERKVVLTSKFCIATSDYLVGKLSKYNPATYEIPLGVDISNFNPIEVHDINVSKNKIIVGLLGFISERQISLEIVNKITTHDKLQLILIGPIESSFLKKIDYPDKVKMTGTLKGKELLNALSKIDVGIALYNLTKANRGTTPNKLWQYIALGKPAVVSNLPNLKNMVFPEKSVYTLHHDDDVIDLILQASNDDTMELKLSRIEFAKQNTWEHRVERFLELFRLHFPTLSIDYD